MGKNGESYTGHNTGHNLLLIFDIKLNSFSILAMQSFYLSAFHTHINIFKVGMVVPTEEVNICCFFLLKKTTSLTAPNGRHRHMIWEYRPNL